MLTTLQTCIWYILVFLTKRILYRILHMYVQFNCLFFISRMEMRKLKGLSAGFQHYSGIGELTQVKLDRNFHHIWVTSGFFLSWKSFLFWCRPASSEIVITFLYLRNPPKTNEFLLYKFMYLPSKNTFLVSGTINNFQIKEWKNNFYDNANMNSSLIVRNREILGIVKKSYKTPYKCDNNLNLWTESVFWICT